MTERKQTTATDEEVGEFIRLGEKIGALGAIPSQVFGWWVSRFPGTPVEVAIAHPNWNQILLVWREDQFFKGWHIPGGFLLQRESWEQAVKRVIQKEVEKPLNFTLKIIEIRKLDPFNFWSPKQDPRGHAVCTLFLVHIEQIPQDLPVGMEFFGTKVPLDIMQVKLPPEIAADDSIPDPSCSSHEIMFKCAIAHLTNRQGWLEEVREYQRKFC